MIQLTSQQQAAVEQIMNYLSGPDQVFILRGYAGTGKTFLIGELVRILNRLHRGFALLAPTGRAARVLADKTRQSAATIHQKIYHLNKLIQIDENEAEFKFHFELKTPVNEDVNRVYFIDEASMVSDTDSESLFLRFGSGRLLSDLFEFVQIKSHQKQAKIIFVGDPAQLPPINSASSPALDPEYLAETYGLDVSMFELTDVIRQETESAILAAATSIRDTLDSGLFNQLNIQPQPGEIEAIRTSDLITFYSNSPPMQKVMNRTIITYSNRAALDYNLAVRRRLWNGDDNLCVQPSELLIVVNNNYQTGYLNGDLLQAIEVADRKETRKIPVGKDWVEITFRDVVLGRKESDGSKTRQSCKIIENVLFNSQRDISIIEQKALYVDFIMRHRTLKPGSADFTRLLLDDPWFNAIRVKFGYAMTCHKAQGGEWDTVAVLFENQRTDRDWLRWVYTAITRARRRVLGINLPQVLPWDGAFGSESADHEPEPGGFQTHVGHAPAASAPASSVFEMNSSPQIQRSDAGESADFEDRFQQAPGFVREMHRAVMPRFQDAGVQVESVDVRIASYYWRYHLKRDNDCVVMQIYFNKKQKFTVHSIPCAHESGTLFQELQDVFEATIPTAMSRQQGGALTFPADKPFLEAFYRLKLNPLLDRLGARVVMLEHLPYRERYHIASQGGIAVVDFLYDGKGRICDSEILMGETRNRDLAERILAGE